MMNMTLLIASIVAMAFMLLLNWLAWRQERGSNDKR